MSKEDDQAYYGVDIKPRPRYSTGGMDFWMDRNIQLVPGVLEEVLFYVADISEEDMESEASVGLQIWSPIVGATDQFLLKWQHMVHIDQGVNRAYRASTGSINGEVWQSCLVLNCVSFCLYLYLHLYT